MKLTDRLKGINPPATLFYALDLLSNREALVMIDSGLPLEPGRLHQLCGTWDESPEVVNYNLFYVETLAALP
jgi:hypothetical protein